MSKLKPCPFCGGKAKQHLSVLSWIECENCGAKTPQYQFDNQSIDAWNNRANGWIPVSERLPEKGGRYLVTEKYYNDKCTRIIFDHYISEIGRFASNQVIAWQPLPELYKEEN